MGRLFGTDGVRGVANSELTCELALNLGRAAAFVLTKNSKTRPKIFIGKDTRTSSSMLESAIAAGMCSFGAQVVLLGYLPTPAVAYLVSQHDADCGVMISASHNPCEYNGIKLFDKNGLKLPDCIEDEIEKVLNNGILDRDLPIGNDIGNIEHHYEYVEQYINHVVNTIDIRLDGLKLAIDCANGCASYTAHEIFSRLGAKCCMLSDKPDGANINNNCGSTHTELLREFVLNNKVDLGLAFDGDSDRCLALDENGELIDGDKIIAILSKQLKESGKLNKNTAVVTIMSNLGFKLFADENGIDCVTTAVGDRYVLEEMLKSDYSIGGEQSGHVIIKEFATTGDGQLVGVQLASVLKNTGKSASELACVMKVLPQVIVNVVVDKQFKDIYKTDSVIISEIQRVEKILSNDGRVLIRASGTEPLIRVMIEGNDTEQITKLANGIAEIIKERAI
ncbi:MAG: phosphoglucosamine mutase [bacterium]|nr:phosphoglucosamine mutase [bacterium]